MGVLLDDSTQKERFFYLFLTCSSAHAVSLIVVVVLLFHSSRRKGARKALLPSLSPLLWMVTLAMPIEIGVFAMQVFQGFDPNNICWNAIFEFVREGFAMVFYQSSLTRESFQRVLLWATLWGMFGGGAGYLTVWLGFYSLFVLHGVVVIFFLLTVSCSASSRLCPRLLEHRACLNVYAYYMIGCRVAYGLYSLMIDADGFYKFMRLPILICVGLLEAPLTYVCYTVLKNDSTYWRGGVVLEPGVPLSRSRPVSLSRTAVVLAASPTQSRSRPRAQQQRMQSSISSAASAAVAARSTTAHSVFDDIENSKDVRKDLSVGLLTGSDDAFLCETLQTLIEVNRHSLIDFQRIHIDEDFGGGSFSKVFRGMYKGKPVAMKCFLRPMEVTDEIVDSCAKETAIATILRHANIVHFYGICVCPPCIFLVLEFCYRGSLYDVLRSRREASPFAAIVQPTNHVAATAVQGSTQAQTQAQAQPAEQLTIAALREDGPRSDAHEGIGDTDGWQTGGWSEVRILRMCLGCAKAVAYMHAHGYIHRDIKSPNFLVTKSYTVKLTDFGLSRPFHVRPQLGRILNIEAMSTSRRPPSARGGVETTLISPEALPAGPSAAPTHARQSTSLSPQPYLTVPDTPTAPLVKLKPQSGQNSNTADDEQFVYFESSSGSVGSSHSNGAMAFAGTSRGERNVASDSLNASLQHLISPAESEAGSTPASGVDGHTEENANARAGQPRLTVTNAVPKRLSINGDSHSGGDAAPSGWHAVPAARNGTAAQPKLITTGKTTKTTGKTTGKMTGKMTGKTTANVTKGPAMRAHSPPQSQTVAQPEANHDIANANGNDDSRSSASSGHHHNQSQSGSSGASSDDSGVPLPAERARRGDWWRRGRAAKHARGVVGGPGGAGGAVGEALLTRGVGTRFWMSPEMLQRDPYTEKTDIYSLSIVMWEIITGCPPFEHIALSDMARAVLIDGTRPPVPPHCPPTLAALLQSGWAADPDSRPSAHEMVQTLTSLLEKHR